MNKLDVVIEEGVPCGPFGTKGVVNPCLIDTIFSEKPESVLIERTAPVLGKYYLASFQGVYMHLFRLSKTLGNSRDEIKTALKQIVASMNAFPIYKRALLRREQDGEYGLYFEQIAGEPKTSADILRGY
jgi:hypothetical protein